jgi:hypothetical protein
MKMKLNIKDKARALWPIRKGCMSCGAKLTTTKEKFTKTCTQCALSAKDGFQMMGQGDFKKGMSKVMGTYFNPGDEKDDAKREVLESKMGVALSRRKKKIIKKLEKNGLSPNEIEEGLKEFESHMGRK